MFKETYLRDVRPDVKRSVYELASLDTIVLTLLTLARHHTPLYTVLAACLVSSLPVHKAENFKTHLQHRTAWKSTT